MMALPRPAHYSDVVEIPKVYTCGACGARLLLATPDPLPDDWAVDVAGDAGPTYTCPSCAAGGARRGCHAARDDALAATVGVTPSSRCRRAPAAPAADGNSGGESAAAPGAWIFFCPCGYQRRRFATFIVHAHACRKRRAEARAR